jgi:hypothetical protein
MCCHWTTAALFYCRTGFSFKVYLKDVPWLTDGYDADAQVTWFCSVVFEPKDVSYRMLLCKFDVLHGC